MENLLTFTGIIMIAFGVLQIILFFKMWGMTNDIREMKNKFMNDNYSRTVEGIKEIKDKYLKESSGKIEYSPKEMPQKTEVKSSVVHSKEDITKKHDTTPLKDIQTKEIDIESEDFNKLISRWRILKKRGFTQQAINEYTEKTSLPIEDAEKFINEL